MLLADYEIVTLADQRNEVEPEHARHGPGCQAAIDRARLHLPGCRQVPRRQLVVTARAVRFDSHALQLRIQQSPAARPFFPIYDGNILPGKIFNPADVFRVAPGGQDALFPNRKRDHGDRLLGEETTDLRQVGFAAGLVSQVCPSYMDTTASQEGQGLRAVPVREDKL